MDKKAAFLVLEKELNAEDVNGLPSRAEVIQVIEVLIEGLHGQDNEWRKLISEIRDGKPLPLLREQLEKAFDILKIHSNSETLAEKLERELAKK
jgi:hypothetical protein